MYEFVRMHYSGGQIATPRRWLKTLIHKRSCFCRCWKKIPMQATLFLFSADKGTDSSTDRLAIDWQIRLLNHCNRFNWKLNCPWHLSFISVFAIIQCDDEICKRTADWDVQAITSIWGNLCSPHYGFEESSNKFCCVDLLWVVSPALYTSWRYHLIQTRNSATTIISRLARAFNIL